MTCMFRISKREKKAGMSQQRMADESFTFCLGNPVYEY